mmetsp:Transcript_9499/g.15873  ORF Transcript_9499/g.15873 Transcript_9499/m.15873 type:complete len:111 (-) Transcript_9499:327-659(-)
MLDSGTSHTQGIAVRPTSPTIDPELGGFLSRSSSSRLMSLSQNSLEIGEKMVRPTFFPLDSLVLVFAPFREIAKPDKSHWIAPPLVAAISFMKVEKASICMNADMLAEAC